MVSFGGGHHRGRGGSYCSTTILRQIYLVDRPLWDKNHLVTAEDRLRVRRQFSAPIVDRFFTWLESIAPSTPPTANSAKPSAMRSTSE